MIKLPLSVGAALFVTALLSNSALAGYSWDGSIELEQRYFWDTDTTRQISKNQTSARLKLEVFKDWNNGDDQILFEPFIRVDSQDDERSHIDIRQLIWSHFGKDWEFSLGLGRVFWGVTESQHLVDIINQTDGLENIDGEDKLGQPMLRYQYFSNIGNFDAYVLPYFRTRSFAGKDSRLNGGIIVDNDNQVFESNTGQNNIDFALRYSNTFGDWGVGLSWFKGTSREADLFRLFDPMSASTTPYYAQIDQFATDIQLTTDAWLLKLEAIQRNFSDAHYQDFAAATAGAEYTFVGVFGSAYDIGALVEYSWDERDADATNPFQDDLFVGARLAFNDINNSEVLFGLSRDLDNSSSKALFIEASTRFANAFTANVEVRYFDSDNPRDPFFALRDHSFIQIGIEYFFD